MKGKVTIIDVAKRAGVSKGTVDRVLHNRGEVAETSAEKVRKAIRELGFEPNLHASLLASRKALNVACLMPAFGKGEYWEQLHRGFLSGAEQVVGLNVNVKIYLFDQYEASSFNEVCEEILASNPAGVVLVPLFSAEAGEFTARLRERAIPYVYVDHKLEEDAGYLAYIGMPMYKSGVLCANLLTERFGTSEVRDIAVIRIRRDVAGKSDPTSSRRRGFMDYMCENFPDARIHLLHIDPRRPAGIKGNLESFFAGLPDERFVAMFNSRINLLEEYLAEHPVEGRCVIGFDSLDSNMAMLDAGTAHVLIAQHTEEQSLRAVLYVSDFLVKQKRPDKRDTFMHMDILTRLNQEYY